MIIRTGSIMCFMLITDLILTFSQLILEICRVISIVRRIIVTRTVTGIAMIASQDHVSISLLQ